MEKILIIGAGIVQVAVIKKAKEMGYYTITIDNNKNAPGIKLADKAIIADITDSNLVLKFALEENINAVIHPCSEIAMHSMGRVNQEMNLYGVDLNTSIAATNKVKMRQAFNKFKLSSPYSKEVFSVEDSIKVAKEISGDFIFKPSRNSASRGITLLKSNSSKSDISIAFNRAVNNSFDNSAIIEQYIDGPEFSVEIVIWNNQPVVITVTDKLTSGDPYFVELGHSQPSQYPESELLKIKSLAIDGCKALGIDWCVAHVEIKLQNNIPFLIEIGARLAGDFISTELVRLSTGIDFVACAIDLAFGKAPNLSSSQNIKGAAIRYFIPKPGILTKIYINENISKFNTIHEIEIYRKSGESIPEIRSSLDRSGHVISIGKDANEAILNAEFVLNNIEYEIS